MRAALLALLLIGTPAVAAADVITDTGVPADAGGTDAGMMAMDAGSGGGDGGCSAAGGAGAGALVFGIAVFALRRLRDDEEA